MCDEVVDAGGDAAAAAGMLSGGIAAVVSTPTDLALVRMMADGR